MNNIKFPKGFYWGAATSSHQVEGGNLNNWTEWEKKNATRLAKEASKKFKPWQQKKFPEMFQSENYISSRACDHYNRYEEDFDIAKSLGHNAHRFSIEWSQVEPEEGKFDEKEIEHYQKVVDALHSRGIEPFVTLWHWTNPLWIRDIGGWTNKKTVDCFVRFVAKISSELKGVKFWITINEPEIFTSHSFLKGVWPPQKKSVLGYFRVMNNLSEAHRKSYSVIKKENKEAQIGIAKNNIYFEYGGENIISRFIGRVAKKLADYFWNFYFLEKIKNYQDFIGLNHYFHNKICGLKFNQNENKIVNDMGWEIYPEAIYYCLKDLKKYGKPIYIAENGLADADDEKRAEFIRSSLVNISRAIDEGVDVRGYLYWSLLDNFEWDKGFWPRFGLVEINYNTMERKIRPSALEYKNIIEKNSSH